jgi:hypothetical protein
MGAGNHEQVRLQVGYFYESVPAEPGWDGFGCAYLEFGHTYDAERAAAESRGWPVRVLKGHHLEMVTNPEAVANAILGLIGRLHQDVG